MADKAETDGVDAPAPEKKSNKILLLAGAAILLAALGGGFYYYKSRGAAHPRQIAQKVQDEPFIVDVPTMMSNLDTGGGRPVFVKISAKLQVRGGTYEAVDAQMPQIQNIFQSYLHECTQAELSGNGVYRLREALLGRIAVQLAPIEVRDLLFTEFLVQ